VNAKATDTSSRPAALMESGSDVPRERVLIFIVAYNAERHIESVLARLPETIFNHTHFHLLIIDDSSYDESASRAAAWLQHREVGNAGVLRNHKNLGYGGNQKLGYRYAILTVRLFWKLVRRFGSLIFRETMNWRLMAPPRRHLGIG
jgi:glycosyltransferase involved in cell wall biosynthesis